MAAKMTHLYEEGAGELKDHVAAERGRSRSIRAAHSQVHGRDRGVQAIERSRLLRDRTRGRRNDDGRQDPHHLKNQLYKPEASLVVVGYQSQGRWGGARRRSQAGSHPRPGDRRSGERAHDRRAVRMPIGTIFSAGWKARARRTPISSMASRRSCRAFARLLDGRGRRATAVERGREYDLTH